MKKLILSFILIVMFVQPAMAVYKDVPRERTGVAGWLIGEKTGVAGWLIGDRLGHWLEWFGLEW